MQIILPDEDRTVTVDQRVLPSTVFRLDGTLYQCVHWKPAKIRGRIVDRAVAYRLYPVEFKSISE